MKKTWLFLCLALILCVGLLCGCGEEEIPEGATPDVVCPICNATEQHTRCPFCQVHTCVGTHTSCVAPGAALTALTDGEYVLSGTYDYTTLFGTREVAQYIKGHYAWRQELTLTGTNYTMDMFLGTESADKRLVRITGTAAFTDGVVSLTPTGGTVYYASLSSETAINTPLTVKNVVTKVSLYGNGTFSGVIYLPFSICPYCIGITSSGAHARCDTCGERVCNGADHTTLHACGLHKVCMSGDHSGICPKCMAPLCNGRDHTSMGACGVHPACMPGEHTLCDKCRDYRCNGDKHEPCPGCDIYLCVGEHGGCITKKVCPGCLVENVKHDHCEFCQGYVCVGDHTNCKVPSGVTVVKKNFSEAYLMSGEVRISGYNISISYDWQLKLYFLEDGTYRLEWWQKAPSRPDYLGPLICWVGTYTPKGQQFELVPTGAYQSDLEGNNNGDMEIDLTVRAKVTMYSDNTFSGYINDLIGKCGVCNDFKGEGGKHDVYCVVCGGTMCTGDHTHGGDMCSECGQSDTVGEHGECPNCDGYFCDGGKHSVKAECGEHSKCTSGNHSICLSCNEPLCNGKLHTACPGCGLIACIAEGHHGECEYEGCDGYLCDDADHFHGGFNCFDHVPYEDDGDCTTAVLCSLCQRVVVPAKQIHAKSKNITHDKGYHWYPCLNDGCGVHIEEAAHETSELLCLGDQKCDSCDYMMPKTVHTMTYGYSCSYCGSDAPTNDSTSGYYYTTFDSNKTYKGAYRFEPDKNRCLLSVYAPELTELYLGEKVYWVGVSSSYYTSTNPYMYYENTFIDCPMLESIEVDPNNPRYMSIDGVLYSKDGTYLLYYPANKKDKTFIIPDTVIDICEYAFAGQQHLETIVFNEKTFRVYDNAFENCASLKRVEVGTLSDWLKTNFLNESANPLWTVHTLHVAGEPVTSVDFDVAERGYGIYTFAGSDIASFTIGSKMTSIYEGTFFGCTNLTSIELPEQILQIYGSAFEGCVNLTALQIPKKLTQVGARAFYGTKITSLTFPSTVRYFGRACFQGMNHLVELTLPIHDGENVIWPIWGNTYDVRTFGMLFGAIPTDEEANATENVVRQTYNNPRWGAETRLFCIPDSLRIVTVYGVGTLTDNIFQNCSQLTEIHLSQGTTTGSGCFSGCYATRTYDAVDPYPAEATTVSVAAMPVGRKENFEV